MAKEATGTALTFEESLEMKLRKEANVLPKNIDIGRFVSNATYMLTHNDTLVKYGNQYGAKASIQIRDALMKAAYLGLDIGISDDYYLYPYGSALNFSLSPIGTVKMIRKYSAKPVAKGPFTELFYEGESLKRKYLDDGTPWFDRTWLDENERVGKKIIGALAWVVFDDGDRRFEYMNIDQLNACRKQSKMANAGAWANHPDRMYIKTVLHRLYRNLDIEFDTASQKDMFNDDMAIITDEKEQRDKEVVECANSVDFEEVIDAEVKPVEESGGNDAT